MMTRKKYELCLKKYSFHLLRYLLQRIFFLAMFTSEGRRFLSALDKMLFSV